MIPTLYRLSVPFGFLTTIFLLDMRLGWNQVHNVAAIYNYRPG